MKYLQVFELYGKKILIPIKNKTMLKTIIDEIYGLDYKSNTFANKSHEESLKSIFINNGFTEVKKNDVTYSKLKVRSNILTTIDELRGQYLFMDQPFGGQKAPDFAICIDGMILWIECKSGNGGKITWNTGYPRNNILYASSDKTKNTTTLFFGQFSETLTNQSDFEEKYDAFDRKWKRKLKDEFKREFGTIKFEFYMRRMLTDKNKYSNEDLRDELYKKTKALLSI